MLFGDGVAGPLHAERVILAHLSPFFETNNIVQVEPVVGFEGCWAYPGQRYAASILVEVFLVIPCDPVLKLDVDFLLCAGNRLSKETLLDKLEQPLVLPLSLGITRLMGDKGAPQLQQSSVDLVNNLSCWDLLPVGEDTAAGVTDELELGVVI